MTGNYLLLTVPIIFLVLLVHLLLLLLVYVGFSVLIVLLEDKTRVRHPRATGARGCDRKWRARYLPIGGAVLAVLLLLQELLLLQVLQKINT